MFKSVELHSFQSCEWQSCSFGPEADSLCSLALLGESGNAGEDFCESNFGHAEEARIQLWIPHHTLGCRRVSPHTADCPTLSVDHLLVTSAASLVIGRVGLDQSMLRGQEGADKSRAGRSPASARHVVGPLLSFGVQPLYLNNHWQRIHRQKHSAFRRERANSQESCPSARGGRRLVRSSQGLTGGETQLQRVGPGYGVFAGSFGPNTVGLWVVRSLYGCVRGRSVHQVPSPRSRRGCWAPSFSMFGRV